MTPEIDPPTYCHACDPPVAEDGSRPARTHDCALIRADNRPCECLDCPGLFDGTLWEAL